MPESPYSEFTVYWWALADGPEVARFGTRRPEDIQIPSKDRHRIHVHSLDGSGKKLEIILHHTKDGWMIKVDSDDYELDSDAYPFLHASDDECSIWTYSDGEELLVIRGLARE